MSGRFIVGDALTELRKLPSDSIDLVMTSPPYAAQRARQYGGPPSAKYVEWYMPIARELRRVLAPTGSYILNIKEHVENGQRSLYALDLVAAHVRQAAFKWHDTYIWHKPNPFPGNRGARLPDAWEPCYQFVKGDDDDEPHIDKQANRRPIAKETMIKRAYVARLDAAGELAERAPAFVRNAHDNPANLATGASRIDTPDAQAHNHVSIGVLAGSGRGISHPAMYPEKLPAWFIRLLCRPGGTVLDPFMGAGTTAVAAEREGRTWIGIERSPEYVAAARARMGPYTHVPLDAGAPGRRGAPRSPQPL